MQYFCQKGCCIKSCQYSITDGLFDEGYNEIIRILQSSIQDCCSYSKYIFNILKLFKVSTADGTHSSFLMCQSGLDIIIIIIIIFHQKYTFLSLTTVNN